MKEISVKVKKQSPEAILPSYGSPFAAGADLYALPETETVTFLPGETKLVATGICVEIPESCAGFIYARSGIASKRGLAPANKVGVIDSDYRGEVMVALHNHSGEVQTINRGERIAQMVIAPYYMAQFEEAKTLSDTTRGAGGFGSTGRK